MNAVYVFFSAAVLSVLLSAVTALYTLLKNLLSRRQMTHRLDLVELFTDNQGLFRFRLKSTDGETIVESSHGYSTKDLARSDIAAVRADAADTRVTDLTVKRSLGEAAS